MSIFSRSVMTDVDTHNSSAGGASPVPPPPLSFPPPPLNLKPVNKYLPQVSVNGHVVCATVQSAGVQGRAVDQGGGERCERGPLSIASGSAARNRAG